MVKTIYYTFDSGENSVVDYEYTVQESLQDVIEYKYYKKYDKPYHPLAWYLEDGAKEFVKEIEDAWLHNTLDMYAIYSDYDFYDWLKDKYEDDAFSDWSKTLNWDTGCSGGCSIHGSD
jgi:hypothetical protein